MLFLKRQKYRQARTWLKCGSRTEFYLALNLNYDGHELTINDIKVLLHVEI